MKKEQIYLAIRNCGYNQRMLSEAIGCSQSLISKVINRKAVSRRVCEGISKAIGMDVSEVFPESKMENRKGSESYEANLKKLSKALNNH